MLPKIKVFRWRIGHDILPTYDNIARIHQNFSTTCTRCKNNAKTLLHAMKEYPKAREVLIIGGLYKRLLEGRYKRCIDWLEDALRVLESKLLQIFYSFLELLEQQEQNGIPGQGRPCYGGVGEGADGCVGYEVIVRNVDGFVLGDCYGFANKTLDVTWVEFEALSWA
ncbi:hypothetical protein CXB51_021924 [Gossypium anomalum]|uniref:Reverse transcriptase zinc-binding domain-containing protein n=1 Tax=Gossypium anomalum TaxID=47600 RepID=A0A8J5YJC4_9ROSI|nr:hypothetical protein CXB51_021924 [Gossypium anomalum]